MGFFDRFKKKPAPGENIFSPAREQQPQIPKTTKSAAQFIAWLEELNYFIYADPADLQQIKAELGEGLAQGDDFPIVESGRPRYKILDPRLYTLDNETLFEQGGMLDSLAEMAPLFTKMNVRMEISDHIEEYDQAGLNHRITLNGKPYVIFHQWQGYGWGESAQRFADIVNDQLAMQNSNERLYLILGAEDGRAVFLTPEQYGFVRPLIANLRECPLPTQEWCKVWGVTWENVVP
jgi:hypothetical protein